MFIVKIIFALFCLIATTEADPIYGADYLAGNKYETAILRTHPQGWAAGIFMTTFGDATPTIERLACSGKVSELVVHIAPFDNSHAYPIESLKRIVLSNAAKLEGIAKRCPKATIMPSPFCEHNHKAGKIKTILDAIKRVAPSTIPVNSIWKGDPVYGYFTEIHLENSRPRAPPRGEYIVSFDGFGGDGSGDFTDANIPALLDRYKTAKHIRLWNFRYNGKFGHKDKTPLNQRKYFPDENYLRGHNAMMKAREGAITWGKDILYKPFADDHGQGGKDNKAMVILKANKPFVTAYDSKGIAIARLNRVLPDHTGEPKGARYYANEYAYQLADKAKKNTGSRLIRIENSPLTDGDLRSNNFR